LSLSALYRPWYMNCWRAYGVVSPRVSAIGQLFLRFVWLSSPVRYFFADVCPCLLLKVFFIWVISSSNAVFIS
jgi:hypothetical protein